jgi:hypothetical protein
MAAIEVMAIGSGVFQVEIREDGDTTTHRVTVPEGYPEELGVESVALNRLVHESFRFLLEREPKEQILATFDLPTIGRYFPEYEDVIGERVRRATPAEKETPE